LLAEKKEIWTEKKKENLMAVMKVVSLADK
jgi:hypothetical protein